MARLEDTRKQEVPAIEQMRCLSGCGWSLLALTLGGKVVLIMKDEELPDTVKDEDAQEYVQVVVVVDVVVVVVVAVVDVVVVDVVVVEVVVLVGEDWVVVAGGVGMGGR